MTKAVIHVAGRDPSGVVPDLLPYYVPGFADIILSNVWWYWFRPAVGMRLFPIWRAVVRTGQLDPSRALRPLSGPLSTPLAYSVE